VVQNAPPSLVAIDAGLSRLEVSRTADGLVLGLLPDVFFPGVVEFTPDRERVLVDLGMQRDDWGCFVAAATPVEDLDAVVARVRRVLSDVLDRDAGLHFGVAIERERVPDNSELISSIQALVKAQDLDSRRLVYQAFLNALVYVPLDLPEDVGEPARVRPFVRGGFVDKGEDWAVYSDRQALERAQLTLREVALVPGIRVVQAGEAQGIAALKINPRSRIGGEFLRNELWMMGDYLRKIGALS
jgi:hypothetical protein